MNRRTFTQLIETNTTKLYHGTSLGAWTDLTSTDTLHGGLYLAAKPSIAKQHAESASESWYESWVIEHEIEQEDYDDVAWPKQGKPILVTFDMSELASLPGVKLEPDWEMPGMTSQSTWRDSLNQHATLSVSGFDDAYKSIGKITVLS